MNSSDILKKDSKPSSFKLLWRGISSLSLEVKVSSIGLLPFIRVGSEELLGSIFNGNSFGSFLLDLCFRGKLLSRLRPHPKQVLPLLPDKDHRSFIIDINFNDGGLPCGLVIFVLIDAFHIRNTLIFDVIYG